jgi:hypothetical protein
MPHTPEQKRLHRAKQIASAMSANESAPKFGGGEKRKPSKAAMNRAGQEGEFGEVLQREDKSLGKRQGV